MSGGFLLDTSALSLLAPGRPDLSGDTAAKLRAASDRLHISTIVLAEVREGVCKLRRKGATARAEAVDGWMISMRSIFAERLVPFGIEEADAAAEIADRAVGIGRHRGFADVAIAGTARANGLAVFTENLRHFEPLGGRGVRPRRYAVAAEAGAA